MCLVFVVVFAFSLFVFFFKQKTAYEMRISDWSSDVCSSDLLLAEVVVPTSLHPLDIAPIIASVAATGCLIVAEEGSSFAGVGAEIVARLSAEFAGTFKVARIGAPPVPIPSVPDLERAILPGVGHVCEAFRRLTEAPA